MPVRFPNPHVRSVTDRRHLGDIYDAARTAGVDPGTIRVWMTRRKIEPILRGPGETDLFHLPTIAQAAAAGAKHRRKPEPVAA